MLGGDLIRGDNLNVSVSESGGGAAPGLSGLSPPAGRKQTPRY